MTSCRSSNPKNIRLDRTAFGFFTCVTSVDEEIEYGFSSISNVERKKHGLNESSCQT